MAMLDSAKAHELARAAYSQSTTYFDASIRLQVENDLRQFQGIHPAGSKYYSDSYRLRSRLFRPKTRATIRKNEAVAAEAFFATHDLLSVVPADDGDPLARANADLLKRLVQHRLTKSIPWFVTLMGAYQDAQTVGVVASYQYWQYDARRNIDSPAIKLLPVENLRFDPASDWTDPINTSPYVIELVPMYVKDIKKRMQPDARTGQSKWKQIDDQKLLSGMRNLSDSTRLIRNNGRTDPQDQPTEITDYSLVWVHRNVAEFDGEDYLFYTLGTEMILSDPKPLREAYFIGRRPYVLGNCMIETHKPYPSGVARLTRDQQAEINEIANQRIDNVKFAMNKRYFVKRDRQVDVRSLTRNVPGSVTLMRDPKEDVQVVETRDVTASAYQEQDRLNLDFDDIAGSFSQSSVQSNRNLNETVGGLNLIAQNTNQVGAYQLLTFVKTWAEPVLEQITLMEREYETNETIIKIAARSAKLAEKYGIQNVDDELFSRDVEVKVNISMGATNPAQKVNNLMLGINSIAMVTQAQLEAYGLKIDEVIKEIMGSLGYQDGARFFEAEGDPKVEALLGMIEQLKAALEAKHPPEMIAAQVAELQEKAKLIQAQTAKTMDEAAAKAVETIFSATQAGQNIAMVPQVAPLADTILRSAGYQDRDAPPIVPNVGVIQGIPPPVANTNPLTPANPSNPAVGMNQGIETPMADSFAQGGVVRGNGNGRSDSVPGVIEDTGEPVAFSRDEVILTPSQVAEFGGVDALNRIVEQLGTETPISVKEGSYVLRADIAEKLGIAKQ